MNEFDRQVTMRIMYVVILLAIWEDKAQRQLTNFAGEPERIWNTQSEDLGECEASRGIDIQVPQLTKTNQN